MKDKFYKAISSLIESTDKDERIFLSEIAYDNSQFLVPQYRAELMEIVCLIKNYANNPNEENKKRLLAEIAKIEQSTD